MKTTTSLFAIFVLALFALGPMTAYATDETQYFAITDVNYDDPIAPGNTLAIEVELTNSHSTLDFEDINLKAWLVDSFGDRVTDKVVAGTMQVQQNSEKTLTLNLAIPEDLEAGDYKLIVEADGIWEKASHRETVTAENTVEIEQDSDAFFIQDVRTSKTQYSAGNNVDVALTVMNNGADDQDNVVVSVAVPELSITKSLKIFGTLFAGSSQTVYMTFALPEDADGGIYTLTATAGNALAKYSTSANLIIKDQTKISDISNVRSTDIKLDDLDVNEAETFQLTIANKDTAAKSYALAIDENGWASITANPTKFDLRPGQTQVVTVTITAEQAGQHTASIVVLENDKAISSVTIEANAETSMTSAGLAIAALAIILAAIVVYFQFYKNGNNKARAEHIYF